MDVADPKSPPTRGDPVRSNASNTAAVALLSGAVALFVAWRCHVLIERAPPASSVTAFPTIAFFASLVLGTLTSFLAVLSLRRAWLSLAAVCLALAWLAITGRQFFTLHTWRRPLSAAEAQEFAAQIEGRERSVFTRVDLDTMLAEQDPDHERLTDDQRTQLTYRFQWDHAVTVYPGGVTRDNGVEVLPVTSVVEPMVVTVRRCSRDAAKDRSFTYLELVLARGRDGLPTCVNSLDIRTGRAWAEGHGRGSSRPTPRFCPMGPEESKDLERLFDELAERDQSVSGELFRRFELASEREDPVATLQALDAIDARVGGDSFLDGLRAEAHSAQGQSARAMELANRAAEAHPDVEAVWWMLLRCAVKAKDHARTRAALDRLVYSFYVHVRHAEDGLDLTEFFASEDGAKWKFMTR